MGDTFDAIMMYRGEVSFRLLKGVPGELHDRFQRWAKNQGVLVLATAQEVKLWPGQAEQFDRWRADEHFDDEPRAAAAVPVQ